MHKGNAGRTRWPGAQRTPASDEGSAIFVLQIKIARWRTGTSPGSEALAVVLPGPLAPAGESHAETVDRHRLRRLHCRRGGPGAGLDAAVWSIRGRLGSSD